MNFFARVGDRLCTVVVNNTNSGIGGRSIDIPCSRNSMDSILSVRVVVATVCSLVLEFVVRF